MEDYYRHGFDVGHGKRSDGHEDYPKTEMDKHSYRNGIEDGIRRRRCADELDDEY